MELKELDVKGKKVGGKGLNCTFMELKEKLTGDMFEQYKP